MVDYCLLDNKKVKYIKVDNNRYRRGRDDFCGFLIKF